MVYPRIHLGTSTEFPHRVLAKNRMTRVNYEFFRASNANSSDPKASHTTIYIRASRNGFNPHSEGVETRRWPAFLHPVPNCRGKVVLIGSLRGSAWSWPGAQVQAWRQRRPSAKAFPRQKPHPTPQGRWYPIQTAIH